MTELSQRIAREFGTPAVVIDLERVGRNVERLQAACDAAGVACRPHIKTHKSPIIAEMQRRAGAKGITCQKLGEAEVMVDAGFCDLLRPALYGAYHAIELLGAGRDRPPEPLIVAGPLCESGDVFTRDERELLDPRPLPRPDPGDLLVLQDAGAYGASMASNYVSMGRGPTVWWEDGRATLIARRETVDDLTALECDVAL